MSMTTADTISRPWRRSLRFSVRGMIVVVLVIGVGLGWLVRSAHVQRGAVAAIRTPGGSVTLSLEDTKITDAGLTHLQTLKKLQILDVSGTRVSDSGMSQLKGLSSLYSLSLGRTRISDAGLAHLKRLTKLSTLDLRGTPVTDAGVNELMQALPGVMIYR
jgi:Leucine rich repeat